MWICCTSFLTRRTVEFIADVRIQRQCRVFQWRSVGSFLGMHRTIWICLLFGYIQKVY